MKRIIDHLTWWIGVDHTAWIPCFELFLTLFLKNNCNGNINQHNNNNNNNNNNNDNNNNNNNDNNNNNNNNDSYNNNNNNSNNIIIRLEQIVRRWKIKFKERKYLLDLKLSWLKTPLSLYYIWKTCSLFWIFKMLHRRHYR